MVTTSATEPGFPASLDGSALNTPSNGSGTDAAVLAALERIERRLARLETSIAHVDTAARGAPALIATLADTFDGVALRASERGIDVDERGRALLSLLERVSRAEAVAAVHGLLDSGLFAPGTIGVLSNLAKALPSEPSRTPQLVGPWGAYRALKEPEVQRALGFLLDVARRLGASLSTKQLPAR
ncbi:MAG: hypothetical protein NVS2B9_15240 [Myxococcales bacterium]